MRYTLRIMIIIFMGISLTVLSFSNSLTFKSLDETYEISPNPKDMKMSYNLYFVGNGVLELETREIKIEDNQFLSGVTDELLKGPKNKLLKSPFSSGSEIKNIEIHKSTLFLNLKNEILNESFWHREDSKLYIWSIVNTYTEFEDIIKVQILVDGKKINKSIGNQNLSNPLMRNDSLINDYNDNPSSRVIEFISYGMISDYASGYKLISSDSRKMFDFKAFILFYDQYIESLEGYEEDFHYYQQVGEDHYIYIKFSNEDLQTDDKNKVERFKVIKEDDRWYVDITDMINR